MITAAFPILERGGNGLDLTDPGMTLRDYFAGQVIGAAFSDLFIGWRTRGEPVVEDWPTGLAIDAYRVADAMLAIRQSNALAQGAGGGLIAGGSLGATGCAAKSTE